MISLGFGRRWSVVCTVPRQRGEKGGPLRRRLCKKINIEGDPRPGEGKKKNGRNRRVEISLIRGRWLGLGVLSAFCRWRERTMPRENGTAKNKYVETARKKKFRTEWPGLRDAPPRKARVPLFYFNAVKEAMNDEVLLETRQATMSHRPGKLTFGGAWLTTGGGVDRGVTRSDGRIV